MKSKINITLIIFVLLNAFMLKAQTTHAPIYPRVKLNLTNAAGSKMKLIQFIGNKIVFVDSAVLDSANGMVELTGRPIEEELQFQLTIRNKNNKMFVLYPVLDNSVIPEIYMNLEQALDGKGTYLDKFRYVNSPSSIDWSNIFYFPVKWKKSKYNLESQFKATIPPNIKREIDSLSNLIKDYRVSVLKSTKSVATVFTGLNLLKFDYSDEDFGELLKNIQERFPESNVVKNKVNWFINTKKYVSPIGEILSIGTSAIDFDFLTQKGITQKLSGYKGSYILLDFWASWCKPCREESPYLKQAFIKYGSKGFKIVQVSIDNLSDEQKWKKAIIEDSTQQFIHTRKNKSDLLVQQYKVTAIPVNYLIDPNGKIVAANLRGKELDAKLSTLLR